MTSVRPVPPRLYGGSSPDPVMRTLHWAAEAYVTVISRMRSREVRPVDRDLHLVVTHIAPEAEDVMGVTLRSPTASALPEWTPGAHIDVVLPSGLLRQYSLCGDPADHTCYRIAVRRIDTGSGGSREIHALAAGTSITVHGPRNAFPYAYPHLAKRHIEKVAFLAGGIGITALLPMIEAAAAGPTPWQLTYIGRRAATMPFLDRLGRLPAENIRIRHGAPPIEEVLEGIDAHTAVYFCGPTRFLDAVRAALTGRDHAGFHFERFSPPPVVGGNSFRIHLQRSNQDIDVPGDTSALAALRQHLPAISYSCQQGFCGTCRADVLAGQVTHRGRATFLQRPNTMLVCVDRATETITLDL